MADANETRRQNEMLDAQLSIVEQLKRQAQERVVFEGQVSDEIAQENDFLRQNFQERNRIDKEATKQLTTQREITKATRENLGVARSIQNVTASELGSKKLLDKIEKDRAKTIKNNLFLQKQVQNLIRENRDLEQRIAYNKQRGNTEAVKQLQDQRMANDGIIDSLEAQVGLGSKLVDELDQVRNTSLAIADDGFLSMFNGMKDIVNLIPGLRELLPGFDQAATSYREALVSGGGSLKEIREKNKILSGKTGGKGFDASFVKSLPQEMQEQLKDKSGGMLTGTAAVEKAKKLGLELQNPLKAAVTSLNKFMKKFLLLQLVNTLLKADKIAGDLSKSFNTTYREAQMIQFEMNQMANRSGDVFVTGAKIAETQMAINKELGTSVMLTEEQLVTMTKLREAAGFTNEELAGIFKLSATTGKEMETITGEVLAQAKISSLKKGVVLNEREILKEISKVSAATTLSLGQSGEAIADAVTTAKALGMELSKVEAIAGSILQFESSIEDELSAELLIGKELNLERARFAALNNDVKTLSEEIAANFGTAAEFGELNRIQQDALAKAVGMNREELAQTLYVQEQLAGVSGEEAERKERILNARIAEVGLAQAQQEIAEEGYETLEQQASVQDRIKAMTEKISEVFATMAPVVLTIADAIMLIVEPISMIFRLVGAIGDGFTWIGEKIGALIPNLGIVGDILRVIAGIGIVYAAYMTYAAVAAALASTVVGGFLAPIAGAVAAAAVTAAGFGLLSGISSADDLMSGPTSNSGYGDRTLLAPEGAFALNNKDTIVAGTNLNRPETGITPPQPQAAFVQQAASPSQSTSQGSLNPNAREKETNVTTKLYIDNQKFAEASTLGFSKL